jgi:hypothetical protein
MEGDLCICGPSTKPKSEIKDKVRECGLVEKFGSGWENGQEITQFLLIKNTQWMSDWMNEEH